MTSPISKTLHPHRETPADLLPLLTGFGCAGRRILCPESTDFCIIIIRDTSQHFRPSSDENITISDRWHRSKCAGGCRNHREMTVFCGSRGRELTHHAPQFLLSTPVSWHLRALGEKFENYYSGAMSAAIKSYGQTDFFLKIYAVIPRISISTSTSIAVA